MKKQQFLIDIAINQVKSRCKIEKPNNDQANVLNMVCASMVNLWINTSNATIEPTGTLKLNNFSINKNSNDQVLHAKQFFDLWMCHAAPLLIDEGFAFFAQQGVNAQ